ncbi:MAG: hypothetical protein R2691_10580 [Solirubrobacterales bacterium]
MFSRSRTLALIGLPLVAVAVAVVALTSGGGDASPTATLAIIFALVGGFVFLLLLVQGREIDAAARTAGIPPGAEGAAVDNPMTVPESQLWASLAVAPITAAAVDARADAWGAARSSHRAAWVICLMIFTFVPAAYLLGKPWIAVLGAIPIAGYAVWRAFAVVGAGGELDRVYDDLGRSVEPLGLLVDERPEVGVGRRIGPPGGPKADVRGALRMSGKRHGRAVSVAMADGGTTVHIGAASPPFEARSSDGRIRGRRGGMPAPIESALGRVPASVAWKDVAVIGGPQGIVVTYDATGGRQWLAALWLAERLADAAETAAAAP